jgi:hypothetical protein
MRVIAPNKPNSVTSMPYVKLPFSHINRVLLPPVEENLVSFDQSREMWDRGQQEHTVSLLIMVRFTLDKQAI